MLVNCCVYAASLEPLKAYFTITTNFIKKLAQQVAYLANEQDEWEPSTPEAKTTALVESFKDAIKKALSPSTAGVEEYLTTSAILNFLLASEKVKIDASIDILRDGPVKIKLQHELNSLVTVIKFLLQEFKKFDGDVDGYINYLQSYQKAYENSFGKYKDFFGPLHFELKVLITAEVRKAQEAAYNRNDENTEKQIRELNRFCQALSLKPMYPEIPLSPFKQGLDAKDIVQYADYLKKYTDAIREAITDKPAASSEGFKKKAPGLISKITDTLFGSKSDTKPADDIKKTKDFDVSSLINQDLRDKLRAFQAVYLAAESLSPSEKARITGIINDLDGLLRLNIPAYQPGATSKPVNGPEVSKKPSADKAPARKPILPPTKPATPFSPTDVVGGALELKKTKASNQEIINADFRNMTDDAVVKLLTKHQNDIDQLSLKQVLDIASSEALSEVDPDIFEALQKVAQDKKDNADAAQMIVLKAKYRVV